MANPLPSNNGKICLLAQRMGNGILTHGSEAEVTMVGGPEMLLAAAALKSAEYNFGVSRSDLRDAQRAFQDDMRALNAWLVMVRAILACRLGRRWTAAWADAGFIQRAAIPDNIVGQISLGTSLASYFTRHPGYEVPSMDITAAEAAALTTAAMESEKAAVEAKEAKATARQAREVARKEVLYLMSTLINNLNCKLSRNSSLWLAFGLRIPSAPITPAAPQNVRAGVNSDGSILVECDRPPLATRFRCRVMVVGRDARYRLAFSTSAPRGLLKGYPPGVTLQIIMQAVNESAQSRPSVPVLFTVPAVVAA